ncbi:hypothetical protein UlMin_038903 [Ulmus minor]
MPTRNSNVNTEQPTSLRRSPRFLHNKTPEEPPTSLRNSTRHARRKPSAVPDPKALETPKSKARTKRVSSPASKFSSGWESQKFSRKFSKSSGRSRNSGNLSTGSGKFRILNNGVEGFANLRRSSRISQQQNAVTTDENKDFRRKILKKADESDDDVEGFQSIRRSSTLSKKPNHNQTRKNRGNKDKGISCNLKNKEELSDIGKIEEGKNLQEGFVAKSERVARRKSFGPQEVMGEDGEKKDQDLVGSPEVQVRRKRKVDEDGNGAVQGWTKEQELALQRAYFEAKPTPHFWKKVSKLVPGKSAQECFDKVNSDILTPPQHQRVSRAKTRGNMSPISHLQLSASKLLKPTDPKVKRTSCNKRKSQITKKNVRHLLRMHCNLNLDDEADLFSVLEPDLGSPMQALKPSVQLSTPRQTLEKKELLQKCSERSSGHKKPLSRFSNSSVTPLSSPPVLKKVKNRVLHEKYIDQLHNRDAKRKAASSKAKNSALKTENGKESHIQSVNVVQAAKTALVSDARDAISKLKYKQTNDMINSSDLDDDIFINSESDDNESENGT